MGSDLKQALDEGLILPTVGRESEGAQSSAYAFLHDRVQQAAYDLIPASEKARVHLSVGRLLLESWNREGPPDRIFDIVGHLNLGIEEVADVEERAALARLNLEAGRRAKASTAYDAGSGYFDHGIALLSDDSFRSDYGLSFELYLEAAECHYLGRRFDVAEGYFGLLLARADAL